MITDIGIELGNLLDLAWHRHGPRCRDGEAQAEAEYDAGKLLLHGVMVPSFLGGGVSGLLADRRMGHLFLFSRAGSVLARPSPTEAG